MQKAERLSPSETLSTVSEFLSCMLRFLFQIRSGAQSVDTSTVHITQSVQYLSLFPHSQPLHAYSVTMASSCYLAVLLVMLGCPAALSHQNPGIGKGNKHGLADMLGLDPDMSLDLLHSEPTIFGTRQGRMRVSCNGETVEDHVSDYVKRNNNTGRELQKEYMRSSRSLRVEDGEVRVVEEVSFLFTNEVDVVRGVVVIDACNGQQLEERNMKAAIDEKHRENQESNMETQSRQRRGASKTLSDCLTGTGGNSMLGPVNFGDGAYEVCLVVEQSGGESEFGRVLSGREEGGCFGGSPISFTCSEGPDDATENGGNSPSLDVAFGLQTIFRVFREWYDMEAPVPSPTACVHYGDNLNNALSVGEQLLFGDGLLGFSAPFTTLGAVCHEYAHLITEKYSNLQHDGQAGGVNDAFADAFSRACRKFTGIDDTWYEGSGLLVNYPQGFRCYADPTFDGFSIDNLSDYEAGMDSHRSCGIFNKFFYCLTETQGTTTIRDGFLTYLLANELFWAPDTSFEDAACGILRSSVLAGVNTESVRTCFGSVGVSLDSCSLDSVEQVLSEDDPRRKNVIVSATVNPYFRVRASDGAGFTVKTNPDVTIMVSTGSAYAEPEVSGVGKVKFNGDVDSDVFVRLQGSSDEREQVDIRVKF
ncbi:hypothetical protein BaRGS_00031402 [Batillaria attramentaria]|uniref:Uncharacterized protein n=1 Tax=Batillaria attramentaria TaxID=370345 RepID=A0ABD0JQZ1_9CAEN